MQFSSSLKIAQKASIDALIIPSVQKGGKVEFLAESSLIPSVAKWLVDSGDFLGKEGENLIAYDEDYKRVIFLGLGKEDKLTVEGLRKAYGTLVKSLRKKKKCENLAVVFPKTKTLSQEEILEGIVEGALFGNYGYDALKKESLKDDKGAPVKGIHFVGVQLKDIKSLSRLLTIHEGVTLARNLVNGNADEVSAEKLCHVAKDLGKKFSSLKVKILHKAELEKNKMGLILAVNRAGPTDPAVILLEYRGDPKSSHYSAVVGKGITYDTGGLNLKPTGSMETMKCDMSGAAAVLGLMQTLASLKLPVNVLGAIGTTENAIGPMSFKPGDVYTSYSGKTVEISNTDAEGRLILADVISYVQKHYKLERIIDLATLTGAIVIALGEEASGLYSNNEELSQALVKAGNKTFERVWPMPIFPEFKEELKSTIADIKNSGSRKGGSSSAALFIKEFVEGELPWAHLDIAGTAYLSASKGYHATPATGVGVRLLTHFFQNNQ